MTLGADRKKLAWLGGLLAVAAIVFYFNMSGSSPDPVSTPAPRRVTATPPPVAAPPIASARRQANSRGAVGEFKLRLGSRDPKDRLDPATIDPTLRLDLLAKVQSVGLGPPGRNIFQTGVAPDPKPIVLPKVPKIDMGPKPAPAPPPPVVASGPPPPPQAPPMTFKYYGFTTSKASGKRSAFLLDGEDILIAAENETVKRRYRVVKIGVNSITIEDTQFKSTQTLPLQENQAG